MRVGGRWCLGILNGCKNAHQPTLYQLINRKENYGYFVGQRVVTHQGEKFNKLMGMDKKSGGAESDNTHSCGEHFVKRRASHVDTSHSTISKTYRNADKRGKRVFEIQCYTVIPPSLQLRLNNFLSVFVVSIHIRNSLHIICDIIHLHSRQIYHVNTTKDLDFNIFKTNTK